MQIFSPLQTKGRPRRSRNKYTSSHYYITIPFLSISLSKLLYYIYIYTDKVQVNDEEDYHILINLFLHLSNRSRGRLNDSTDWIEREKKKKYKKKLIRSSVKRFRSWREIGCVCSRFLRQLNRLLGRDSTGLHRYNIAWKG